MDILNFAITLIVFLIIVAIVLWAVRQLLAVWSVDPRIGTTVYVLIVILFVLAFLQWSGLLGGGWWRVRR